MLKVDFFGAIKDKSMWHICKEEISDFCKAHGFVASISETYVVVRTKQALWKFNLKNMGHDLIYVPKRGLKVPHKDMRVESAGQGVRMVMKKIIERILLTEERLKAGVGSEEVVKVLEKVSGRVSCKASND